MRHGTGKRPNPRSGSVEKEFHTHCEAHGMSAGRAIGACKELTLVSRRLNGLQKIGLGYLTLGE